MRVLLRLFKSYTLRLTILLCLTYLFVMGALTIVSAMRLAPVMRQTFADQAAVAVKTAVANMSREDQAALRKGQVPSSDAIKCLELMVEANDLWEVAFWYEGKPFIRLGTQVLSAGINDEISRVIERRHSAWTRHPIGVRASMGRGLLILPTPGRSADPITIIIPYDRIRNVIGQTMYMYMIQLVITALIGLIAGYFLLRALNKPLQTLRKVTGAVATGKLRTEIPRFDSTDSLGELYKDIGRMQASLGNLVKNLIDAAHGVGESAGSLDLAAKEASRSSQSIASTMSEMSNGVGELASTIRTATELIADMATQINHVTGAAETMSGLSQETLTSSEAGREVVVGAVGEVNALNEHVNDLGAVTAELRNISTEIGEVVQFIASVSEQTNLLALNASIEAAHAGEFGVTFSVLAERIQMLSADAAAAGEKIKKHVRTIMEGVNRVDAVVDGSKDSFARAADRVRQAGDLFTQIETMVREIVVQSEHVSRSGVELLRQGEAASERMQNIAAFSEEMAASVEEVAASAEEQAVTSEQVGKTADELVRMANGLGQMATQFDI
ncbi:MAG: methyl-accepting chemotaxis protein [Bacteroidota bacterium]